CRSKRQHETTFASPSLRGGEAVVERNGGIARGARIDDKICSSSLDDDRGCDRHNLLLGRTKRGGISGTAGVLSHSDGRRYLHLLQGSGTKECSHHSFAARSSIVISYVSAADDAAC